MKERDIFAENGIRYTSPFVSMAEPDVVPKQIFDSMKDVLDLDLAETQRAVEAGYRELRAFNQKMRDESRKILTWCAREGNRACWCWGVPITWTRESATKSKAICRRTAIRFSGCISSYPRGLCWMAFRRRSPRGKNPITSRHLRRVDFLHRSNTNEILWGAKFATRFPWITCVLRLSSYECGMDQPTYTPTQKIVEATGTLFFKFGRSRFHQTRRRHQDPNRDHRPLFSEVLGQIIQKKLALSAAELPLVTRYKGICARRSFQPRLVSSRWDPRRYRWDLLGRQIRCVEAKSGIGCASKRPKS